MAARAIVGILLGMLFAPVIYLLLYSIQTPTLFSAWFWSMTSDFNTFLTGWLTSGIDSTIAPLMSTATHPNSLILAFGPTYSLLSGWLPAFLPALLTWTIVGAWAGAIERSGGRGIGVGIGCWLGWLIIAMLIILIAPAVYPIDILDLLLGMLMTAIVVIIVAGIFGALTRAEEF